MRQYFFIHFLTVNQPTQPPDKKKSAPNQGINRKMASESVDADIRAEIPALLSIKQQQQNKLLSEPQCQQRWGWRDDQRPKLSPNEVAEFVRTYAWPKETELVRRVRYDRQALKNSLFYLVTYCQALQCLFEGDYDVPQAVEILHKARREKLRLKREETERIHNITFERAMDRHGKKFHLVKVNYGGNQ